MRILIDVAARGGPSSSTDLRYARGEIRELLASIPGILPGLPSGRLEMAHHVRRAYSAIGHRVGSRRADWSFRDLFSRADWDLVFSNAAFPVSSTKPVIWQNTIVDPVMRYARGVSQREVELERRIKIPLMQRSVATIVATSSEAERLIDYGVDGSKLHHIPFFHPGLSSVENQDVERKHDRVEPLRVVFVGNDAHRKNIGMLLNARALIGVDPSKFAYTIVSHFTDGEINIPPGSDISVITDADANRARKAISSAHVLVNLALFETYGFVFIEALSLGTVPIAPHWEAQREILADGERGLLLDPRGEAEILASSLEFLRVNRDVRTSLALAGKRAFDESFSPQTVRRKWAVLLQSM